MKPNCSITAGSSGSQVMVYRRVRVGEVFRGGCRDIKKSLAWQLVALKKSMEYKADVPNFLEPSYGIDTVASCFGVEYHWCPGHGFASCRNFSGLKMSADYIMMIAPDWARSLGPGCR